ncbi:hypothetical protein F2P56_015316 [Juglans regia]|uniref:ATP-dependent DNA helicase n=2 Tax=Juglans regia TaxID=51240 RepID=A0A833XES5_JUGRE|nr:ATP-dependent DNA helicase PIF2-like [Juglans regia]KAF5465296.1 hypothetical protein F2P56_015316 [Juglans regia]
MGKDINTFHLVDNDVGFDDDQIESRLINDELTIIISEEDLLASSTLNHQQQNAYNAILQKVFRNQPGAFFIDGTGCTVKPYIYKALIATVRSKQLITLAIASYSIAASIFPRDQTAHSRIKISLDKNAACSVSKHGGFARLIQLARLIIWDETPMSRKESIEALDKMLRNINNSELTFGGKVIVFGGDFRQVLSVVRKGISQEQIDASFILMDHTE